MTTVENKITVGSLLSTATILISVFSIIATGVWWGGKVDQRMLEVERRAMNNSEALAILGREVSRVDGNFIRLDEKLNAVLEAIADLKHTVQQ